MDKLKIVAKIILSLSLVYFSTAIILFTVEIEKISGDASVILDRVEKIENHEIIPDLLKEAAFIRENIELVSRQVDELIVLLPEVIEETGLIRKEVPIVMDNAAALVEDIHKIQENISPILTRVEKVQKNIVPVVEEVRLVRKQIPSVLKEVEAVRKQIPEISKQIENIKEITPGILVESKALRKDTHVFLKEVNKTVESVQTMYTDAGEGTVEGTIKGIMKAPLTIIKSGVEAVVPTPQKN